MSARSYSSHIRIIDLRKKTYPKAASGTFFLSGATALCLGRLRELPY